MHLNDILWAAPWILICLALVLRSSLRPSLAISSTGLSILFLFKMLGAFVVQAIYTYFYTDRSTSDIYRFFDDGLILSKVAERQPMDYLNILIGHYAPDGAYRSDYFEQMNAWIKPFDEGVYNDNIFMIKLNSLFNFLSQGVYEVNAVLFTTLAFVGLMLLVCSFSTQKHHPIVAAVAILFPSSLLWFAGGLKESMLIFSMGALSFLFRHALRQSLTAKNILLLVLGVWVGAMVKPYVLVFLVAAMGSIAFASRFNWRFGSPFILLALFLMAVISFHTLGLDVPALIAERQQNFLAHSEAIQPGSFVGLPEITADWRSLLVHAPLALAHTITQPIQPSLWASPSLLMGIENILLWTAIIWFTYLKLRDKNTVTSVRSHRYLLLAIYVAIPGLILIGLTTPVLGAMMRYRAPFILLIIVAVIPYLLESFSSEHSNHTA